MKISIGKPQVGLERVCIYGAPKVGKTRLATSLPWGEYWGEQAIYVGADLNAETLKSVLLHNRNHLALVTPDGLGLTPPNWMEEAFQIALRDWRKDFPEAKTLIWDTMTQTSIHVLRQYSDSGVFSDKHNVQVGSQATGSWHTSPMEGDYGAAQDTVGRVLEALVVQPLHVIVIFHEDWLEPKQGSVDGLIGGPATIGKKSVRWVPGKFDTVIYMQRMQLGNGKNAVVANTIQQGIWPAGVRGGDLEFKVPPQIPLDVDPVDFWKQIVP